MSHASVLSRPRTRRRRPPSSRIIIWTLLAGCILSQTAWAAIQIARGDWYLILVLPIYVAFFAAARRSVELLHWCEQKGFPLPPASLDEWAGALMLCLVQLALWVAL